MADQNKMRSPLPCGHFIKRLLRLVISTAATVTIISSSNAADAFPETIHVDAAKTQGELKSIWRFFGADEPNYAYKTLARVQRMEAHGLAAAADAGTIRAPRKGGPACDTGCVRTRWRGRQQSRGEVFFAATSGVSDGTDLVIRAMELAAGRGCKKIKLNAGILMVCPACDLLCLWQFMGPWQPSAKSSAAFNLSAVSSVAANAPVSPLRSCASGVPFPGSVLRLEDHCCQID